MAEINELFADYFKRWVRLEKEGVTTLRGFRRVPEEFIIKGEI